MELTFNKYDLKQRIQALLIEYIAKIANLAPKQIDVTASLKYYMDSLMLTQMRKYIETWLGFPVKMPDLFDDPTIETLSTDLVDSASDLASLQKIAERVFGSALASLQNIAERVFGSADIARDWLARPNPALGNQIPNELLKTPDGEKVVYELLMRIEYGVYS